MTGEGETKKTTHAKAKRSRNIERERGESRRKMNFNIYNSPPRIALAPKLPRDRCPVSLSISLSLSLSLYPAILSRLFGLGRDLSSVFLPRSPL